jgi:hypothetical protein
VNNGRWFIDWLAPGYALAGTKVGFHKKYPHIVEIASQKKGEIGCDLSLEKHSLQVVQVSPCPHDILERSTKFPYQAAWLSGANRRRRGE